MKCSRCGSEIELGCVYCANCGKEAMIVSDLNVLEDEVLREILDEDALEKRKAKLKAEEEQKKKLEEEANNQNKNWFVKNIWSNKRNRILFIAFCLILAILLVFLIINGVYRSDIKKGMSYDDDLKYEEAISMYDKAISLKSSDTEARVLEAYDYMNLENYTKAQSILLKAYEINPTDSDVIEALIKLYTLTNDKDQLNQLKSKIKDSDLLKLFDTCSVNSPKFSEKSGEYNEDFDLEITASSGCKIYYTLDGTNPTASTGTRYKEAITISDGTTTVKAIAVNSDGQTSFVSSAKYKVSYEGPSDPVISPDGGTYSSSITITVSSSEDCDIYYTWDNSDPTINSTKYTGPITIKEGNNVLSVVAIDKHNMTSKIVRSNFNYQP